MIAGITNSGSLPVLEAMVSFSGQRHRLITNNIANFSTPNYRPKDVSPARFREALGEAAEARREANNGRRGELELPRTRDFRETDSGRLELTPRESGRHVLFHDRNNRDLERTMQDLAENVATFRVASELWKHEINIIRAAVTERP